MGRKAGLKQIMEVETMKKLFKRGLAMAFCLLCLTLGQVQAFDFMADVDEVSRDPYKAYTLYKGMPTTDFRDNYSSLSNWSKISERIYCKNESLNGSVIEWIKVFTDEKNVSGYEIYFLTNSLEIADRIFERLTNNLEKSIGRPNYSDKWGDDIKSNFWEIKNNATWGISVEVRYGIKRSSDDIFKKINPPITYKHVVFIVRY